MSALSLDGLRLLLVEDHFALATNLADVAVQAGADVIGPVATVDDALRLIAQVPEIEAAVLDIQLGTQDSFPVADALHAQRVPFVFSTAVERAELPARFRHVPVCAKPFGLTSFRQALAGLRAAA